jgi:hypothetical protein
MTTLKILDAISSGIKEQKVLIITLMLGNGEDLVNLPFCPYIEGRDIFLHHFIWGYVPNYSTFFKVRTEDILSAYLTNDSFEVDKDTVYRFHPTESHSAVIKSFEHRLLTADVK